MTDPVVRLEPTRLTVEPGGQTRVVVTVRNPGSIVEGFRLEVLGEGPASWAEVIPPEVPVYPQQEATATVVFSPPAGPAAPGGVFPFGVRAASVVDPSSSAVAEGDLEIGRVFGLQSKLTPVTSSGRWRGRHTIALTNWGNAPVRLRLVASDPDQRLGLLVNPEIVEVPLGGTNIARLKVRTRQPFLRGTRVRLPFQVAGEPDPPDPVMSGPPSPLPDPRRLVLDGALMQKPILSRGTVGLGIVAGLAVVAVTVLALRTGVAQRSSDDEGPPDPPSLTAAATTADTVRLSWPQAERIDSYKILVVDPASNATIESIPVSKDLERYDVPKLRPGSRHCFQLQALHGKLTSGRSNLACTTTARGPAAPGPTPTPTGSPAATTSPTPGATSPGPTGTADGPSPTEWIAVIQAFFVADEKSEMRARQFRKELAGQEVRAEVLLSSEYPDLDFAQPAWIVYVRFDSQAAALAYCGRNPPSPPLSCLTRHPGPKGSA